MDKDGTKSIELGAYGVPETYLVDSKTKEILKNSINYSPHLQSFVYLQPVQAY